MPISEPREAYLKGMVIPGVFDGESGFIFSTGDRSIGVYANKLDILEGEGASTTSLSNERPGKLRVFVVEDQGTNVLVLLRQEAGTGEKVLLVDREHVEYVT